MNVEDVGVRCQQELSERVDRAVAMSVYITFARDLQLERLKRIFADCRRALKPGLGQSEGHLDAGTDQGALALAVRCEAAAVIDA